jgi:hypothetical protein
MYLQQQQKAAISSLGNIFLTSDDGHIGQNM